MAKFIHVTREISRNYICVFSNFSHRCSNKPMCQQAVTDFKKSTSCVKLEKKNSPYKYLEALYTFMLVSLRNTMT